MNHEQLKAANLLVREREELRSELRVWENELTSFGRMAYISEASRYVTLDSKVPPSVFDSFRDAAINHLRARVEQVDASFNTL